MWLGTPLIGMQKRGRDKASGIAVRKHATGVHCCLNCSQFRSPYFRDCASMYCAFFLRCATLRKMVAHLLHICSFKPYVPLSLLRAALQNPLSLMSFIITYSPLYLIVALVHPRHARVLALSSPGTYFPVAAMQPPINNGGAVKPGKTTGDSGRPTLPSS